MTPPGIDRPEGEAAMFVRRQFRQRAVIACAVSLGPAGPNTAPE